MRDYTAKEKAAVKRELRNCYRVTGNPNLFKDKHLIETAWRMMRSASKQNIFLNARLYERVTNAYLKNFSI